MTKSDPKTLRISTDVELPLALVTHRNAILAMSGAGKSNAAIVLAEEMHRAGVPWCLFDPKGDSWGVRAAADGKGKGLDIPILGGDHADLPLSPLAGSRVAELVATGRLTGVFDLSDFSNERQVLAAFMADFATTLLSKQRTPIHLFLDEADEYLPQPGAGGTLDGNVARCVGAWKRLATKGRQKGIGFTLISQRAANVNKTALYQCETLIAMRSAGKRDRVAVREFVESHGQADDLVQSLPSLADGEAWIWSPVRLKMMQRVKFRRRSTFDSGRTPEIGEALVVPTLGAIDLGALRTELAAFAEPADRHGDPKPVDDPAPLAELDSLRARVAELENHPVEILTDEDRGLFAALGLTMGALQQGLDELRPQLQSLRNIVDAVPGYARGVVPTSVQEEQGAEDSEPETAAPARRVVPSSVQPKLPDVPVEGLSKCARSILVAIVQHGDLSLVQAAIVACYASNSGTVRNAAGELRSGGYAEGGNDQLSATTKGKGAAKGVPRLPTGAKLAEYWYGKLGRTERNILSFVVRGYPGKVSLAEAATRSGYEPSSGTVRNAAGKLRTLNLVHGGNSGMTADKRLV